MDNEEQRKVLTEKVIKFLGDIGAEVVAVPQINQEGRIVAIPYVIEKQDEESKDSNTGSEQTEGRDQAPDSAADVSPRSNSGTDVSA